MRNDPVLDFETVLDFDCRSDGCIFAGNHNGVRTQDGQCRCLDRPGAKMKLRRFIEQARKREVDEIKRILIAD